MKRSVSKRLMLLLVAILFFLSGCATKVVNIDLFSEGLLAVYKDGRYGYIDSKGKKVIEFYFDEAYAFQDGIALVKVGTKYSLINKKGVKVIDEDYDYLERDVETGLVWYVKNDKLGLMNTNGKIITDAIYQVTKSSFSSTYYIHSYFSDGLARVSNGTKYGFIDSKGQVKIDLTYDGVGSFVNGLAYVKVGSKYGYIDKKNKLVIAATYDTTYSFNELGHAIVAVGSVYKVIDKANKVIIDQADDIDHLGDYYLVEKNNKVSLYSSKGVAIDNQTYDTGGTLYEGFFYLANVSANQLYIFSPKNKLVMSFTSEVDLDALDDFFILDGIAWASIIRTGTVELVNGKAKDNRTFTGDRIIDIDQNLIIMRSNSKYGLLDMKGNRIVEFLYENLILYGDGNLMFKLDGKYGVMTLKGKIVIEAKYTAFQTDLNP